MRLIQLTDTTSNRSITVKVEKMEMSEWEIPEINIHVLEGEYKNLVDFDQEWDGCPTKNRLEFFFSLDLLDARKFTNALKEEIQSE